VPFCIVLNIAGTPTSTTAESVTSAQSASATSTAASLPTCPAGTLGNSGPDNSIFAVLDANLLDLIAVCVVADVGAGTGSSSSQTASTATASSSPGSTLQNCPAGTLGNYGPNNSLYATLNVLLGQLVAICVVAGVGTSTTSSLVAGQSTSATATTSVALALPTCPAGTVGNSGPDNSILAVDLGAGDLLDVCLVVGAGSVVGSTSVSVDSITVITPAATTSATTTSITDCPSSITTGNAGLGNLLYLSLDPLNLQIATLCLVANLGLRVLDSPATVSTTTTAVYVAASTTVADLVIVTPTTPTTTTPAYVSSATATPSCDGLVGTLGCVVDDLIKRDFMDAVAQMEDAARS
jgi:hypothetical protein